MNIIRPICFDHLYAFESSGDVDFKIVLVKGGTETTIYSGRCVLKPNSDTLSININRICKDYVKDELNINWTQAKGFVQYYHTDAYCHFRVYYKSVGATEYITTDEIFFYYDWSYRENNYGAEAEVVINEPINGHSLDNGQYIFKTVMSFDEDGGNMYSIITGSWANESAFSDLYQKGYCGNGAIYYINAKGGWDSFLIEGSIKRTDNYERYTLRNDYDNTSMEYGTFIYNNTVTPSWEVNSGYLTDVQSKILARNLLSSPRIYFHSFEDDKVYPAYITDSNGTYKTHKNTNGMVNYTINIKASQEQQRL